MNATLLFLEELGKEMMLFQKAIRYFGLCSF